jgi:uncharacterized protein with PhoU and TrkA domain
MLILWSMGILIRVDLDVMIVICFNVFDFVAIRVGFIYCPQQYAVIAADDTLNAKGTDVASVNNSRAYCSTFAAEYLDNFRSI